MGERVGGPGEPIHEIEEVVIKGRKPNWWKSNISKPFNRNIGTPVSNFFGNLFGGESSRNATAGVPMSIPSVGSSVGTNATAGAISIPLGGYGKGTGLGTGTLGGIGRGIAGVAEGIATGVTSVGALTLAAILAPTMAHCPAPSIPLDIPKQELPKVEVFYRAMSAKEYKKMLGLLIQRTDDRGNYKGEGPFVTPSLEYAQKALSDFKNAKKYDLIVEYTVEAGTKEMLDRISLPNTGVSGPYSEMMGLPIKKVENVGGKPVTNYSFYGTNTLIFNARLVAPPIPIQYKK